MRLGASYTGRTAHLHARTACAAVQWRSTPGLVERNFRRQRSSDSDGDWTCGMYRRSRHHGGPSCQAQHHQEEEEQVPSRAERPQDHCAGAPPRLHAFPGPRSKTVPQRDGYLVDVVCLPCWVSPSSTSESLPAWSGEPSHASDAGVHYVVGAIHRPRGAGPRALTPATAASSRAARPCPTWVMVPTRSTATFCPTVRAPGASWLCVCGVCVRVRVPIPKAVAPPRLRIPARTDEQRAATDAAHSGFKKFLVHNVSELEMLMMHNRCVPSACVCGAHGGTLVWHVLAPKTAPWHQCPPI